MLVACPHCGFLVAAQSGATLRCPRCASPIDPRQAKAVAPAPPAAASADAAQTAPGSDAPAADTTVEIPVDDDAPSMPAPPIPAAARRTRRAPSFVRRHAPAQARREGWRSWLAVAGLGVLLAMQMLLAQRDALAATARWRPLVSGLCSVLQCDVPAWREPAAFTMIQRSVQPKPGMPGVLHVNASFRNDARWAQPWPVVVLSLSDMDGRQVGLRAFRPGEYRNNREGGYIAPGQSATIQLDVIEPARQVVAFTFDFR